MYSALLRPEVLRSAFREHSSLYCFLSMVPSFEGDERPTDRQGDRQTDRDHTHRGPLTSNDWITMF